MERLLEVGLSNAVVAAALAVVATMAGLVCRRPALVHALWLLVLVKLVTPPLVSIPVLLPVSPPENRETIDIAESTADALAVASTEPAEIAAGPDNEINWSDSSEPTDAGEETVIPEETGSDAVAPVAQDIRISWEWIKGLAWVWVIGSLSWFALASRRVWRFSRALRHARPSPALQVRVARLAERIGLTRCPTVLLLPGRLAPLVWGFGRPVLVLPEGLDTLVGEGGLDTLLLHELAHIRRRDHVVRWLEFLALGLFWWNPVVWYSRRELREAEEQCCDAWVVRTLPGTGRAYATALVDAIDFLCEARPALPPLASGLGQVADLKRRLTMILRGNTPAGLGRSNGLFVCGLALFLLPLVPVWGRAQKEERNVSEKVIEQLIERAAVDTNDDFRQLKIEIERKAAELAALKAKLELMARKTAERATQKKAVADTVLRATVQKRLMDQGAVRIATGGPVIRIEIHGLDVKSEAVKDLVATLEKSLPGKEKRVVLSFGAGAKVGSEAAPQPFLYRFSTTPEAGKPVIVTPRSSSVPQNPNVPMPPGMKPPATVRSMGGARPSSDNRIDNLEKKLDLLLRELESLRRDMKRGAPRGGSGAGGGFGSSSGAGSRSGSTAELPEGAKPAPIGTGSNRN